MIKFVSIKFVYNLKALYYSFYFILFILFYFKFITIIYIYLFFFLTNLMTNPENPKFQMVFCAHGQHAALTQKFVRKTPRTRR